MREIKLQKNLTMLVDDEDYPLLSRHTWFADKNSNTYYAKMTYSKNLQLLAHRIILTTKSKEIVDHIDGNGLNNQKTNLRVCSQVQNIQRQNRIKKSISGFRGVVWVEKDKRYHSAIIFQGKSHFLGLFENIKDAAEAYDKKALELYGSLAYTNFSK